MLIQIEYSNELERIIEVDDPEGGWVDTHHYDPSLGGVDEKVTEMTLEETQTPSSSRADLDTDDDDDDNEEAADMEAFEVSGMLDEQDKVDVGFRYTSLKIQFPGWPLDHAFFESRKWQRISFLTAN